MEQCLSSWWAQEGSNIKQQSIPPDDYTNIRDVPIWELSLLRNQSQFVCIVLELKQIMQWWTGLKLTHSKTDGMRIYQRDSMHINHLDKASNHMVSAMVQVIQKMDSNSGWPLELIMNDGELLEIYLKPNQMVLYEGARLFHGHPMRLKGSYYGNIYSHFSPFDWNWQGEHTKLPDWAINKKKMHNEL